MSVLTRENIIEELTPRLHDLSTKMVKHIAVVNPADMEKWINTAIKRDPMFIRLNAFQNPNYSKHQTDEQILNAITDRVAYFGFERSNYITGTDAVKVTAGRLDRPAAFGGDASTVAQDKLFKIAPLYPDSHIMRGKNLEYQVRDWAIEQGFLPREDLLAQFKENQKAHPYLRGTPDDILEYSLNGKKKVVIGDYKLPATAKGMVMHDYVMQLHHYAVCALAGNKSAPDNKIDLQGLMMIEGNMKTYSCNPYEVDWNEQYATAIIEEAANVHHAYTNGQIPKPAPKKNFYMVSTDSYASNLMSEFVATKVAISQLIEKEEITKNKMEQYLAKFTNSRGAKIEGSTLSMTAKTVHSIPPENLAMISEELGVDIEGKTPGKASAAILDHIEKNDLNIDDYAVVVPSFYTRLGTKKTDKEFRAGMAQKMDGVLNKLIESPDKAVEFHKAIKEVNGDTPIYSLEQDMLDATATLDAIPITINPRQQAKAIAETQSSPTVQPESPTPATVQPLVKEERSNLPQGNIPIQNPSAQEKKKPKRKATRTYGSF